MKRALTLPFISTLVALTSIASAGPQSVSSTTGMDCVQYTAGAPSVKYVGGGAIQNTSSGLLDLMCPLENSMTSTSTATFSIDYGNIALDTAGSILTVRGQLFLTNAFGTSGAYTQGSYAGGSQYQMPLGTISTLGTAQSRIQFYIVGMPAGGKVYSYYVMRSEW